MEPRVHRPEVANLDVRWQLTVERLLEPRGGHAAGEGERDHLLQRMDPGVRSAGSVDRVAGPVAEAGQTGFELSLDRPDPGPLSLEAGEVRSVVFNPGAVPLTGRLGGALSSAWLVGYASAAVRRARSGRSEPRRPCGARS